MTLQQREVMLAFMKAHENFAKGKISNLGPDGARVKASLVKDLAAELNSLPNGATKSGDKWMKVCCSFLDIFNSTYFLKNQVTARTNK